jgi:glutamyl-tRNA reductase
MTGEQASFRPLQPEKPAAELQSLKVISFTHKNTPLKELNRFFLHEENRKERLAFVRFSVGIDELLYLATCNRIEFIFSCAQSCDRGFVRRFFQYFRPDWTGEELEFAVRHGQVYEGEEALRHLYRVASSLDSLVVGEREIITQVRKSYEKSQEEGLTGDLIRLLVKSTITTAKRVYTETRIANNPVSVVSLAERKLRNRKLPKDARILVVGTGETNTNLVKYLLKQGFHRFVFFNRTLANAEKLGKLVRSATVTAEAYALSALSNYKGGFDVLISCTGSADPVITMGVYERLLQGELNEKVLVDLAIPADIEAEVIRSFPVHLIDIAELKAEADRNLAERQSEFLHAEKIIEEAVRGFQELHRTRSLELRMREVPEKIREIRQKAVSDIFAKDIEGLDDHSREVLDKVIDYLEKKYISVPMIMAKEILLNKQ